MTARSDLLTRIFVVTACDDYYVTRVAAVFTSRECAEEFVSRAKVEGRAIDPGCNVNRLGNVVRGDASSYEIDECELQIGVTLRKAKE